ncbi:unnamed protein product [Schistosoma curassoni]|uniref:Ovule protein n=1 Tax=Schistosoma curassoni TaxID=6186 RepID=A0A183KGK9_9TREM|nr:unnamed protein product [Schistosoma curassoni]
MVFPEFEICFHHFDLTHSFVFVKDHLILLVIYLILIPYVHSFHELTLKLLPVQIFSIHRLHSVIQSCSCQCFLLLFEIVNLQDFY